MNFIFIYFHSCRSVTSKLTFLIGWRAQKRSWETEKADRRTSMWLRSSERWSVKGRLSSKSWWWVERLPHSILSQMHQRLSVPGWQEVLPAGVGQQRDGIQQSLQFQRQCWCHQPSDQGEWAPVQELGQCCLFLSSSPIFKCKSCLWRAYNNSTCVLEPQNWTLTGQKKRVKQFDCSRKNTRPVRLHCEDKKVAPVGYWEPPHCPTPTPKPPSENRKALSLFSHCSPLPQHPPSPHPSHLPMPSFALPPPPPPQEVLGQNQGPQSFRRWELTRIHLIQGATWWCFLPSPHSHSHPSTPNMMIHSFRHHCTSPSSFGGGGITVL